MKHNISLVLQRNNADWNWFIKISSPEIFTCEEKASISYDYFENVITSIAISLFSLSSSLPIGIVSDCDTTDKIALQLWPKMSHLYRVETTGDEDSLAQTISCLVDANAQVQK